MVGFRASLATVVLLALSAMMRLWVGITSVEIGPVRVIIFLSLSIAAIVLGLALTTMVRLWSTGLEFDVRSSICFSITAVVGGLGLSFTAVMWLRIGLAAIVLLALTTVMGFGVASL
jgi:hypothetical protein